MRGMKHICAIICFTGQVSRAAACLRAILQQTRAVQNIIIATCADDTTTQQLLQSVTAPPASTALHVVRSQPSSGPAGCLAAGMYDAFSRLGAQYVWETDESSCPYPECLEQLEKHATPECITCPLPITPNGELSLPISLPNQADTRHPKLIISQQELPHTACFNSHGGTPGALYPRAAWVRCGCPNAQLVTQGERADYAAALMAEGFCFCTVRHARLQHPAPPAPMLHYRCAGADFVYRPGKSVREHYYHMRNRAWTEYHLHPRAYLRRLLSCGQFMLSSIRAMIQANELTPHRLYLVFRGQHNGFYGKLRPF